MSGQHATEFLEILDTYDDYISNIHRVCDMGAGLGEEALWFATRTNSLGKNRQIKVTAYELHADPKVAAQHENITWRICDYSNTDISEGTQDLILSNNSFQYTTRPLDTLIHWNKLLRTDGMLAIFMPINNDLFEGRDTVVTDNTYNNNVLYNYTLGSMIYMLASVGFDCRTAHFAQVDNMIKIAVYKAKHNQKPVTDLFELQKTNMLPTSLDNSIIHHSSFKNSDLKVEWIDRSQYMLNCI